MTTELMTLYSRMLTSMRLDGMRLHFCAVKFFRHDEEIPEGVMEHLPTGLTLTSCQAVRQASLGDAVLLTAENG